MSKHHVLKIMSNYAHAKLNGFKPFEIRFNDRDFHVGDTVSYVVLDASNMPQNERIEFEKLKYRIVYITDYMQQENYIVFTDVEEK